MLLVTNREVMGKGKERETNCVRRGEEMVDTDSLSISTKRKKVITGKGRLYEVEEMVGRLRFNVLTQREN